MVLHYRKLFPNYVLALKMSDVLSGKKVRLPPWKYITCVNARFQYYWQRTSRCDLPLPPNCTYLLGP